MERIKTLKQYDRMRRKDLCAKYDVPMSEVNECFKSFRVEWWEYALKAFESGGYFSPQHWAALSDAERYQFRRTHRALKPTPPPSESFYTQPSAA